MNFKKNLHASDELTLTIYDLVNLLKHGKLVSSGLDVIFDFDKKFCGLDAEDKIEIMRTFKGANVIKLIETVENKLKERNI
jgi:hypothetical protein